MYCLKCKKHHDGKDALEVTMKNGRKALKGPCPICGTICFQILKKEKPPLQTTPTE